MFLQGISYIEIACSEVLLYTKNQRMDPGFHCWGCCHAYMVVGSRVCFYSVLVIVIIIVNMRYTCDFIVSTTATTNDLFHKDLKTTLSKPNK